MTDTSWRRSSATIVGLMLVVGCASGQTAFTVSGYAKNLALTSKSVFTGERYALDLGRFRIQAAGFSGPVHVEAWLDTELQAGSFFDTPEAALGASLAEGSTGAAPWVDLDWHVADGDRWTLDQRVFRATATWYDEKATVTIGRQRVAWGTGFVWTPTDVLHPVQPAAIEREEKGGVDAAQVVIPLGPFSAAEMVMAPGGTAGGHRYAARLRGHVGEYDLTAMGGRFADRWIVGGDFAGYVGNAGFRGEAAATRDADGSWTVRAVTNGDYTFADGLYAFLELHFNGSGASTTSAYDHASLARGQILNLGRWYAATAVSWLATPLTTLSGYVVHNLTDGSSLLGPTLSHSLAENLEAAVGVYFFRGGSVSEYGVLHDAGFLTLQFYF